MSDAKKFRDRASDCRSLAANARTEADRTMLGDIADELDAEADRIEKEEAAAGQPAGDEPEIRIPPENA
jgi:hypothetical protein